MASSDTEGSSSESEAPVQEIPMCCIPRQYWQCENCGYHSTSRTTRWRHRNLGCVEHKRRRLRRKDEQLPHLGEETVSLEDAFGKEHLHSIHRLALGAPKASTDWLATQLIAVAVLSQSEQLHELPVPFEPDGQTAAQALGIEELQSEQPSAGSVTGQGLLSAAEATAMPTDSPAEQVPLPPDGENIGYICTTCR